MTSQGLEQQLASLKKQMEDPSIWQDRRRAKRVGTEISRIEDKIKRYRELEVLIRDSIDIARMAEEEGDSGFARSHRICETAALKVRDFELETLLSGEYDSRDAIVTLHAGAGGTEAMDWVSMLYRMYSRWAERKGFQLETLDILPGEEAGLKSVSFSVRGDYAYGFLRTEKGVHRLVRISLFDANQRRHTSFRVCGCAA